MDRRITGLLAACMLTVAGCAPAPVLAPVSPTTSSATATPAAVTGAGVGAPGLGDPYFGGSGNGGYDVDSYQLDVRYDPATDELTGTATITATATSALSRFNFDLVGLTVASVTVDGVAATVARDNAELVITPAAALATGARFVAVVDYHGVPKPVKDEIGDIGFLHTDDGALAIGEPFVASSWFPVNDHPSDKATYQVTITAPSDLVAISNGTLEGKTVLDDQIAWKWSESKPMASYLATVVIGDYRVQESEHDGLPVFIAVDSSLPSSIDKTLARTGDVVDYLATKFGPYPFDAMGGVVVDDPRIRFALENQSRPIYSRVFFGSGDSGDAVIVHELAHQWFGDSVSVADWSHIWLNEGFASYAEWLWDEDHGGSSAQTTFNRFYALIGSPMWKVAPGAPGRKDIFDQSIYIRGAMTLHALRVRVGDDDFFTILKEWAASKAYGNATTDEFIALAERVSGKQLDALFDDWLYDKSRPKI